MTRTNHSHSHSHNHSHSLVLFVLLLIQTFIASANGFLPVPLPLSRLPQCRPLVCTSSSSNSKGNDNDNDDNNYNDNEKRIYKTKNDFRTFMNQCSLQSFLFLARQLRDVETVAWVEAFVQPTIVWRTAELATDPQNYVTGEFVEPDKEHQQQQQQAASGLLKYHGLGAINSTLFPAWETLFLELLQREREVYTVASPAPHVPSYEMEINPPSLCARILSVREQIAREWAKDLDVLSNMSERAMESYWEALKEQQQHQQQQQQQRSTAGSRDNNNNYNNNDVPMIRLEKQNLLFMEWDPNDDSDYAPSPLRKGNFDLLTLLTTQEAVHRILNDSERDNDPDEERRRRRRDGTAAAAEALSNSFLSDFYERRLESHFAGAQRYSRADEFLEELLATPPIVVTSDSDSSTVSFIDTMSIAERILQKRQDVCQEWKAIAEESPSEHMGIRRMMLNRLMGIET